MEVENTLREIRERVLASAPAPVQTATQNGVSHSPQGVDAAGALARMDANLSTTARAWSRLPPVLTNRRGALARFELWLKRLIKRAAHWFTWEQVNFNSAAHNALGDARDALARLNEELAGMRAQVDSSAARASELEARVAELQGAVSSGLDNQRARTEELRNELRDRAEGLSEEQRVCFRQLSLEASELAVTQDRARRAVEARLEAVEKAVNREP